QNSFGTPVGHALHATDPGGEPAHPARLQCAVLPPATPAMPHRAAALPALLLPPGQHPRLEPAVRTTRLPAIPVRAAARVRRRRGQGFAGRHCPQRRRLFPGGAQTVRRPPGAGMAVLCPPRHDTGARLRAARPRDADPVCRTRRHRRGRRRRAVPGQGRPDGQRP
ncbi:hypothetical protein KXX11_004284, partial [Aspergillus fumigatus]